MELAELRLLYGPSVIRTAASPKKPVHRLSDDLVKDIMRPEAPPFVFRRSLVSCDRNELGELNQVLCRALEIEREAHHATGMALIAAHREIETLWRKNRTITATNQMLKSIINHNKKTGKAQGIEAPRATAQEAAVRAFSTDEIAGSTKQKSILFDMLDQQIATYEKQGLPRVPPIQENPECSSLLELNPPDKATAENDAQLTQQAQTLLRTPLKDTAFSKELLNPRTAEKVEGKESSVLVGVCTLTGQSPGLVPLETGHTGQRQRTPKTSPVMSPIHSLQQVDKAHKQQHRTYNVTGNQEHAALPTRQSSNKIDLSGVGIPCLDVPMSFLSKYPGPSRASTPSHQLCVGDSTIFVPAKVGFGVESEDGSVVMSEEENSTIYQQKSKIEVKTLSTAEKALADAEAQAVPKEPLVVDYRLLPGPGTFMVTWKMHSKPFDAPPGKRRRFHDDFLTLPNCKPGSRFWEYPVRYLPSLAGKNLYRTIMIDYIPLDATYKDVLATIHTGAIKSIEMFPPIGNSRNANYLTARVVFPYEDPAYFLLMQGQNDAIKVNGQFVRVWQPQTATYPQNQQLEDDIYVKRYTRLLVIQGAEDALPKLLDKLAFEINHEGSVVEIGRAHDGVPMVEFTNIASAVNALRKFQGDEDFNGAEYDFETDYTDRDALERM